MDDHTDRRLHRSTTARTDLMTRVPREAATTALHVKPGTEWAAVLGRAAGVAPEAFGTDRLFNLVDGSWRPNGDPETLVSPDVDRALDGVRWYVEEIESMLGDRTPLDGPVSNIASWNYPMSVLVHAMLVQALAGNAVIAKTPTDGGVACLTLAA